MTKKQYRRWRVTAQSTQQGVKIQMPKRGQDSRAVDRKLDGDHGLLHSFPAMPCRGGGPGRVSSPRPALTGWRSHRAGTVREPDASRETRAVGSPLGPNASPTVPPCPVPAGTR